MARPDVPKHATALVARGLSANTERGVVLMRTVPRGVLAIDEMGLFPEETPGGDSTVLPTPPPTQRGRPPALPAEAFPPRPCCGVSFSLSFNEVRFGVAVGAAGEATGAVVVIATGEAEAAQVVLAAVVIAMEAGGRAGTAAVVAAGAGEGVGE